MKLFTLLLKLRLASGWLRVITVVVIEDNRSDEACRFGADSVRRPSGK